VTDVVIIDGGGANLASLRFAFERLGAHASVSQDAEEIRAAPRVVLPGVGSAGDAMQRLRSLQLDSLVPALRQPVLGICLGMQLLYSRSDEGDTTCLGILREDVRKMTPAPGKPVPHMGWNQLELLRGDELTANIEPLEHVYFVHSYGAPVGARTLATFEYGERYSAVVRERNFWGTQFHPERSGSAGARILRNFLKLSS
jgi:imidazole glycerol-phosphate synthase subunit HisH